jgi:hypothetical protein
VVSGGALKTCVSNKFSRDATAGLRLDFETLSLGNISDLGLVLSFSLKKSNRTQKVWPTAVF